MYKIFHNKNIINNKLVLKKNLKKKIKKIFYFNKNIIFSLKTWMINYDFFKKKKNLYIWLDSKESPKILKNNIFQFKIISINFSDFLDGRGYSIAYYIRNFLNYKYELRAIGNIVIDQIFYMYRLGFNSFILKKIYFNNNIINFLNTFSYCYQKSINN